MKFHLALEDGRWIGGMSCRRDNLKSCLEEMKPRAIEWQQIIVATKVSPRGKTEVYRIGQE